MKDESSAPEKKKGFFGRFFNRIASPTALKIFAVVVAISCIFSPIGFALGVASTVFSFAAIVYGVYSETQRMRETRKMQKELATLTEIDAIADGMREIGKNFPKLAKELSSVIPPEKNTSSSENNFPKVKQSAYECVKKIPELGFCLVVTIATQNVVAAVFSGATWMASILNGGANNVSYAEKLHKAEDRCFQLASNQGFSYVLGSKDERLAQILQQKREAFITLKIVENDLKENPDLDVGKRFFEVRHALRTQMKTEQTQKQEESWFSDLKTVLFDKGFSAEEGNKLYMPEHIPQQFDDILQFSKDKERINIMAVEYQKSVEQNTTEEMNTAQNFRSRSRTNNTTEFAHSI